ncbi:hypothetical protein Tco_1100747, partial [Tanacetum coccineum]
MAPEVIAGALLATEMGVEAKARKTILKHDFDLAVLALPSSRLKHIS